MATFVWAVAARYGWESMEDVLKTPGLPGVVLAAQVTGKCRRYHPMENPALFREFADLGGDPLAYLGFAKRYGHLTRGVHVTDARRQALPHADEAQLIWPDGETKSPTALPDPNFESGLETLEQWEDNVAAIRELVGALGRTRRGAAASEARRVIRESLRYRVELGFDDAGSLAVEPTDLLAALWLQLAHALTGNGEPRSCESCGRWFLVSGRGPVAQRATRADKKYCGDPCRQAAAYARRTAGRRKGRASRAKKSRG